MRKGTKLNSKKVKTQSSPPPIFLLLSRNWANLGLPMGTILRFRHAYRRLSLRDAFTTDPTLSTWNGVLYNARRSSNAFGHLVGAFEGRIEGRVFNPRHYCCPTMSRQENNT